jgi:hypothetical protein
MAGICRRPDAAVLLEDRAGIDALGSGATIGLLTRVRWRADVDVEPAVAVKGDAFVFVLTVGGKAGHDRLRGASRLELALRQLHPFDGLRMREVDVAVAQRNAGGAATAERLLHLEAAVAVCITQRDSAAAGLRLTTTTAGHQRHVEVAIRRNSHVPRRAEILGDDERTESRWQCDATIVGIAHRPRLSTDSGDQKPQRGDRAGERHCTSSAEIHNASPVEAVRVA